MNTYINYSLNRESEELVLRGRGAGVGVVEASELEASFIDSRTTLIAFL